MPKHILVTGAGGFIGQDLAAALLQDDNVSLTLTDMAAPPVPAAKAADTRVKSIAADLTDPKTCNSVLEAKFDTCYLLHGIMSGGAEANLELGLKVNVDSHRQVLDYLREHQTGVKVVFPSSLAVFGPEEKGQLTVETTMPIPQSSYGAQKLIVETLVNDYSRRGLIDGRIVRLPTVIVRPGAPSAAASSFASGIVRESLKGEENILPVNKALEMWVCSPKTVVKNLVHAMSVPKESYGVSRVLNLPGQVVSVGQILDALERVGGLEKRALVKEKNDAAIEKIVGSWPARFDTGAAKKLGFHEDISLDEIVKDFADSLR